MSLEYVRRTYGVPLRLHQLVRRLDRPWNAEPLRVRSADSHVYATDEKTGRRYRFHPDSIAYKTAEGWFNPVTKEVSP